MDSNELINEALNKGNHMPGGKNLFVLVGYPECNECRVITLDEMYAKNILSFSYQINGGFVVPGIYNK